MKNRNLSLIREGKDSFVSAIGTEVDWDMLHQAITSRKIDVFVRKKALGLFWGTLPTRAWLASHGWRVDASCGTCGGIDNIAHCLFGCISAPSKHDGCKETSVKAMKQPPWRFSQEATVSQTLVVKRLATAFPKIAARCGCNNKCKVYTDGSVKWVGTGFAVAACAVVQFDPRGNELGFFMPLPTDFPQSAVAAEMFAVFMVFELIARGVIDLHGENGDHPQIEIVSDCQAVVQVWSRPKWRASPRFKYAGLWRHWTLEGVSCVTKIPAHRTLEDATEEPWAVDWRR